jgi:hypothetical protein
VGTHSLKWFATQAIHEKAGFAESHESVQRSESEQERECKAPRFVEWIASVLQEPFTFLFDHKLLWEDRACAKEENCGNDESVVVFGDEEELDWEWAF